MTGLLVFAVLTLLFLAYPTFKKTRQQANDHLHFEENKALYQQRRQEVEENQQELSEAEKQALLTELDREFLTLTQGQGTSRVEPNRFPKLVFMMMTLVAVTASSLVLYQYWGAGNELRVVDLLQTARQERLSTDEQQELRLRLQRAQEAYPEQLDWRYYRGRLLAAEGNHQQAAELFRGMLDKLPEESTADRATALTLLAQAEFFAADRQVSLATYQLLQQALTLEPQQIQALGLAGIMAYELELFADAVQHWRVLWQDMPAGPDSDSLADGIRKAAAQSERQQQPLDISWLDRASIRIKVNLTPSASQKLMPNNPVFVFARASQDSRIPVAVVRTTVAELPAEITLTDRDVMTPGIQLSQFDQVTITARASVSGTATPVAGDWQAKVVTVSPSDDQQFELIIDQQIQ